MSGGMKLVIWPLVATALTVGSGCARPDWIEQTLVTVDVTGVWRGSSKGAISTSMEFTLQQSGPKVTGQLRMTPGSTGPIEGTVSGDIFTFRETRERMTGKLQVNGDEMTGSGTGSIYGASEPVTFNLRREQ